MSKIKYNYCKEYIKKLIKLKGLNTKIISNKLGITNNSLGLKFNGHVKLYINEGIIISNMLKMDLYNVFAPSDYDINKLLLDNIIPFNDKMYYRLLNINYDYIKYLLKSKGLTYKDVNKLWNKKKIVFEKLKGVQPITLEEGVNLGLLLDISINDLFCPDEKLIVDTMYSNDLNYINKIKNINPKNLKFKLDKKNYSFYITYLLHKKNISKIELSDKLGYNISHTYNKLKNNTPLTVRDVDVLCNILNLEIDNIFFPNDDNVKEAKNYLEQYLKKSVIL